MGQNNSKPHSPEPPYTVFISHAGEDKHTIAYPLFKLFQQQKISAFLDVEELRIGEDAPDKMIQAMQTAPIGVFILSPEFLAKRWPMKELMCFQNRCDQHRNRPLLVSLFYRVGVYEVRDKKLFRLCVNGENVFAKWGFFDRVEDGEISFKEFRNSMSRLARMMGLENEENATNEMSDDMFAKRERLVQRVFTTVMKEINNKSLSVSRVDRPRRPEMEREVSGQQDIFIASTIVPANHSHVILDYDKVDENGKPTTMEGIVKAYILDQARVPNITALYGMAGVGKTCALRGIAHHFVIRTRFPDGVYFLSLGMNANEGTLMKEIIKIIRYSGGKATADELTKETEMDGVLEAAKIWFHGKKFLVLLDDLWDQNKLGTDTVKQFADLIAAGRGSALAFTTRDERIASKERNVRFIPQEPLGSEARQILFHCANFAENEVSCIDALNAVEKILRLCGGLHLALAVAGRVVSFLSLHEMEKKEKAFVSFLTMGGSATHAILDNNIESYGNLATTLSTALTIVDRKQTELGFHTKYSFSVMYRAFCILGRKEWIPSTALQIVWELDSSARVETVMEHFASLSLVSIETRTVGEEEVRGLTAHDLILDYAVAEAERAEEVEKWHIRIVKGYLTQMMGSTRDVREWWVVPDDFYFHANIGRHLCFAGRKHEFQQLLLQPQWTLRQLEVGGINQLETDFLLAAKDQGHELEGQSITVSLKQIAHAARLSSSFTARNMSELRFQMYARLFDKSEQDPNIRLYLHRLQSLGSGSWLQAMSHCLTSAGGSLHKIVKVDRKLLCLQPLGDETTVACGDQEGNVIIVDIHEGTTLNSWKGHQAKVSCMSTNTDGTILLTGSADKTVKIWNVHDGMLKGTFSGHLESISCLMITQDNQRIISCSHDASVHIWEVDNTATPCSPFVVHDKHMTHVRQLANTNIAVSVGRDNAVRFWDVTNGHQVRPALTHQKAIRSFEISGNQEWIVTGFEDGSLGFWKRQPS